VLFGRIVELGLKHKPDRIADGEHTAHARRDRGGQVGGFEPIAISNNDDAVALGKCALLYGPESGL
jgi:hypothetical protein